MPRKKQDQPQRLGLQSHGDKAPAADTVTEEEEMSCVSDTEERTPTSSPKPPPSLTPTPTSSPKPPPSLTPTPTSSPKPPPSLTPTPTSSPKPPPSLTPTPTSSPKPPPSLTPTPTSSSNPLDHNATPTPTSSSMVVQDRGPGLGLGQDLCQDTKDNPDKDLSLSSILALLCGGNPLQGLGRELASSPPCALVPVVTTLGGEGRMKGGRREGGREGDSSPLGLLPDVPPLSQHSLQLSALAQRVAKNSSSSFSFTLSSSSSPAAVSSNQQVSGCSSRDFHGRPAGLDVWPSLGCSWAGKEGRLSPDSAIQRLREAAANAVLHNRPTAPSSSSSLSSSFIPSSSSSFIPSLSPSLSSSFIPASPSLSSSFIPSSSSPSLSSSFIPSSSSPSLSSSFIPSSSPSLSSSFIPSSSSPSFIPSSPSLSSPFIPSSSSPSLSSSFVHSSSPSHSSSIAAGGAGLQEGLCLTLDSFPSPLSAPSSSASSTLTALSQKVNLRGQGSKVTGSEVTGSGQQRSTSPYSFLSFLSPDPPSQLTEQSSSRVVENQRGPEPSPMEENQTRAENQVSAPPQPQVEMPSLHPLLITNPLGEINPGGPAGVFQCSVCGLRMKRKSYWRRHMSVHTGLKSQQCQLCPFRCARKDNLTAHMKVHRQQEKGEEFQCDLCPFTSFRLFSLKLHMRRHQRTNPGDTHTPTQEIHTERDREGKEETETGEEREKVGEMKNEEDREGKSHSPEQAALKPGCRVQLTPRPLDTALCYSSSQTPLYPASVKQEALEVEREGEREGEGQGEREGEREGEGQGEREGEREGEGQGEREGERGKGRDKEVRVKEEPQEREFSTPLLSHHLTPLQPSLTLKRNRRKANTPPDSPSPPQRRTHTPNTHTPSPLTHTPLTHIPIMIPMATSLFSPDINTKTASDLLIKLSAATQQARVEPGAVVKQEPQEEDLSPGQQQQAGEPGLALSPDGPGASPEPPTSHLTRPEEERDRGLLEQDISRERGLLEQDISRERGLLEQDISRERGLLEQDISRDRGLLERERVPIDISVTLASELLRRLSEKQEVVVQGLNVKEEEEPMEIDPLTPSVTPDPILPPGERAESGRGEKTPPPPLLPKEDQDLFQKDLFSQDISVKMASALLYQLSEKVCKANELKENRSFSSPVAEKLFTHTPSTRPNQRDLTQPSPDKPRHVSRYRCPVCSYQAQCQRSLNHHLASHTSKTHTTGFNYYYRCHVCGFELEGWSLFLGHMTEHSEWERDAFTLRCSVCDHSTSEERAMRAHASSHTLGEAASQDYLQTHLLGGHTPKDLPDGRDSPQSGELRCPLCSFSTSRPVSMVTHMRSSHSTTDQHRCRICQRSFSRQPELQAHVRCHRQGNQYRCERCGHLARTANKLIEHVRVHTGERPFTCDLCPYSAKRRDSLRLHCRLKHPEHTPSHGHTHTPSHGHTHTPSHGHGHTHTPSHGHTHTPSHGHTHTPSHGHTHTPSWFRGSDLFLVPLTTLLSLRPLSSPRPSSPSRSSSPSPKLSFLAYLGLTEPT
ncbi:zinc finger protein 827-like isoform X2 [Oncorhynchus masou masou]|uniref:zinc finger protein 827-like isoform X2 n=1 Tax=Oncorhynchus masou masou TaxID=90313 RepID=UPI00318317B8